MKIKISPSEHLSSFKARAGEDTSARQAKDWVWCSNNALSTSAWNEGYPNVPEDFTITGKASTRAFSWLKAPTSAFTFKNLFKHYAEEASIFAKVRLKL